MSSARTVALALALTLRATCAHADGDAVTLGRVCASEAGLPHRAADRDGWTFAPDCAAILAALRVQAAALGETWRRRADAYSGRATGARRALRRPWLAELDEAGTEPRAWPARPHLRWIAARPAWLALLEHARALLREPSTCRASDWCAPALVPRALALGLVRVDCGATRNAFFMRRRWADAVHR
jgi:hypothetical protein